jgi:Recombination endonuclease VII
VRAYLLKRKYRLTPEERTAMIEEQGGCCEICRVFQGDKLEVDHNHSTGRVRAMLCHNCNSGLGMFGDSYDLLSVARSYLYHYDEMGD